MRWGGGGERSERGAMMVDHKERERSKKEKNKAKEMQKRGIKGSTASVKINDY